MPGFFKKVSKMVSIKLSKKSSPFYYIALSVTGTFIPFLAFMARSMSTPMANLIPVGSKAPKGLVKALPTRQDIRYYETNVVICAYGSSIRDSLAPKPAS